MSGFIFGAKMATFCIKHIGNRKIFLKLYPPESQLILFARKCVLLFNIVYVKNLDGTRGRIYPIHVHINYMAND